MTTCDDTKKTKLTSIIFSVTNYKKTDDSQNVKKE